jgi:hypothetical protein
MSTQPEALILADALEDQLESIDGSSLPRRCQDIADEAATELRRLYTENELMKAAQPEQEPVLWIMPDGKTADKWALQFYGGQKGRPLYTTPPRRLWTGLTDGERERIMLEFQYPPNTAQAIEAKLKEKNT